MLSLCFTKRLIMPLRDQIAKYLLENPIDRTKTGAYNKAAKRFGVETEVIRRVWRSLRRKGSVEGDAKLFVQKHAAPAYEQESTFKKQGNEATISKSTNTLIRNEKDLAKECEIDLTKWRIKEWECKRYNAWIKNKAGEIETQPKYSVWAKMVQVEATEITATQTLELVKTALRGKITPFKNKAKESPEKALVVILTDQHVGSAILENSLYEGNYDGAEFSRRMDKVAEFIASKKKEAGGFEKLIICNLGDSLDGFNRVTTRGGHSLPQNMSNRESLRTYVDVNKTFWDRVLQMHFKDIEYYCIENSNHGGLGWDYAGNLAIKVYLELRAPHVKVVQSEKIIESFKYGIHNLHLIHGKDEVFMRRNHPFDLNARTENYFKQYIDLKGFSDEKRVNTVLKGDLHQYGFVTGKFFNYFNAPSLFGSSDWIIANIGYGRPGFSFAVLEKNTRNIETSAVWL